MFIAKPNNETSLARGFGEGLHRYTRMKNFTQGVRGYLFPWKIDSCVLGNQYLAAAGRYVLMNPICAGIMKAPCEYPWSSARIHAGLTEHDPFVKDWTLNGFITNWQKFLASEDDWRMPEGTYTIDQRKERNCYLRTLTFHTRIRTT